MISFFSCRILVLPNEKRVEACGQDECSVNVVCILNAVTSNVYASVGIDPGSYHCFGNFEWCDIRFADCMYVNMHTHRYACFCIAKCHLAGCRVPSRGCNVDWYGFMSVRVVWDRSSPTDIGKETVHGLCLFLSTASCGSSFYPVPSLYEHVSVRDVRCSGTYSAKFESKTWTCSRLWG